VVTDISNTKCADDPNKPCEDNTCVEGDPNCVVVAAVPLPAECTSAICRTPGFWGTHACWENPLNYLDERCEKEGRATNITQAVIDMAGGSLGLICGSPIDNTALGDEDSAVEAICVSVKGNIQLQLVRQLTAAALNCVVSGGPANCVGVPLYQDIFHECNLTCTNTAAGDPARKALFTECISKIDCLNNGRIFENGVCRSAVEGNCHQQPLCGPGDSPEWCYEPPGPAGSSNECNDAIDNECFVINGGGQCAHKDVDPS